MVGVKTRGIFLVWQIIEMTEKIPRESGPGAAVSADQRGYSIRNSGEDSFACSHAIVNDIVNTWAILELAYPTTRQDITRQDMGTFSAERLGGYTFLSFKNAIADYLQGAGLALNPLPQEQAQFFETDHAALLADWQAAFADMSAVCKANDAVKSWMHERAKNEQPVRRSDPAAKRNAGVKVDT
jgi:hypothetical protein